MQVDLIAHFGALTWCLRVAEALLAAAAAAPQQPPRCRRRQAPMTTAKAREFDYCRGCFALKSAWLWVSASAPYPPSDLIWSSAQQSTFYHIHQGSYGMPGAPPAFILLDAQSHHGDWCVWQRESLVWRQCATPIDCDSIDCNVQGYEAEQGTQNRFFLRRSQCESNCSYIQEPDALGGGALRMTSSLAHAAQFEAECVACPGASFGLQGYLLILFLALLALLPIIIYGCYRARRERCHCGHQQSSAERHSPWPRRKRSAMASILFQLGWMLAVLGLSPAILWAVGRWWTGNVAEFYVLWVPCFDARRAP